MDIGQFDHPVKILFGGSGKIRIVTSTREAAECLVGKWPIANGPMYVAAGKACLAVLEDSKKARAARRAFEAAAKEADILVE